MKNISISFNATKCNQCGICIEECPIDILEMKNNIPSYKEDKTKECIECGHCYAICKTEAVNVSTTSIIDNEIKTLNKTQLSYEDISMLLAGRRSIRCYKDKNVEQNKIEQLLNLANKAPTAKNSQMVEWIVYNNKEDVKKVSEMTVNLLKSMIKNNHPIATTYRLERIVKLWDERGYDSILRNAPALLIAHTNSAYGIGVVDSTIALTYIDAAANSLSLGTCWAGILMIALSQSEELSRKLLIPEGNTCRGIIMLGYPKYDYFRIPPRKKPKIIWA